MFFFFRSPSADSFTGVEKTSKLSGIPNFKEKVPEHSPRVFDDLPYKF